MLVDEIVAMTTMVHCADAVVRAAKQSLHLHNDVVVVVDDYSLSLEMGQRAGRDDRRGAASPSSCGSIRMKDDM